MHIHEYDLTVKTKLNLQRFNEGRSLRKISVELRVI